jgi:hypothetical protein
MNKLYAYALGLCLTSAMVGCKKEDSDQAKPNAPTLTAKETLLTDKNWRITALTGTTTFEDNTITFDGYTALKECHKDDFIRLNGDKTALRDEGATKCASNDPQKVNGTWALNNAETEITFSGSLNGTPREEKAQLLQLTATTMQVKTTTTQNQSGFTIVSTATTTYTAF